MPTTFENQGTATSIWPDIENATRVSDSNLDKVKFSAFIDGVERTSVVYWVAIDKIGAMVPIILSHIAAGVTLRNEDKRLQVNNALVKDKLLLLLPLAGMEDSGFDGSDIRQLIDKGSIATERDLVGSSFDVFGLNGIENDKLLLCDTTFTNIERNEKEDKDKLKQVNDQPEDNPLAKRILFGDNLLNSYRVRQRALGRVNTIRQILEMTLLAKFRETYQSSNNYILVDGPLFFLGKWVENYAGLKGLRDDKKESFVLRNAVGMVKTLKSRPTNTSTLKKALNLEENEYTELMSINDAVDVTGEDNAGTYTETGYYHPHITSFYRFRLPKGMLKPTSLGLTRIDLHVSTFDVDTFEEVKSEKERTEEIMKNIISGVSREKWPSITQKGRVYNEVFPIGETEKMLRSRLYSFTEMNYLYSYAK